MIFVFKKNILKLPISDFNFPPIYVKLCANPCYITSKFIFAIKFFKELSHILRMLFTLLKISTPPEMAKKFQMPGMEINRKSYLVPRKSYLVNPQSHALVHPFYRRFIRNCLGSRY